MRFRIPAITAGAVLVLGIVTYEGSRKAAQQAALTVHSTLPLVRAAKTVLNSTTRHREWLNISVGSANVRAFIVYPERSDKAPVVVVTGFQQAGSDWVRAVADQVAEEGYIAAVPDVLTGMGPNGGDSDSFKTPADVVAALKGLGEAEIDRRVRTIRESAMSLPASNGKNASLEFYLTGEDVRIKAMVDNKLASFDRNRDAWPLAIGFLNQHTGNHPVRGENPNVSEDHTAHMMMALAQTPPPSTPATSGPRGYPLGKLSDLPAGIFNAHSVVKNSALRKEFVDIPLGNLKLHTWIEYPDGGAKAPVVIVMQHGPGMDDWQRALADQLALQGFIAVAPDLHSGLGPNGGNYDSFDGTDDVMRANAKLTPEEMMRRYKAARDYGLKLPRSNGKTASVGFCMGGGNSFRFAGEVPELNAAVVFYGTQPDDATMAKIKAPVLGFYGEDDARVTTTVQPTTAAMNKLHKVYEPHIYPHATHGFLEYQDLAGNPAAVADSWSKTIAFLKAHTK